MIPEGDDEVQGKDKPEASKETEEEMSNARQDMKVNDGSDAVEMNDVRIRADDRSEGNAQGHDEVKGNTQETRPEGEGEGNGAGQNEGGNDKSYDEAMKDAYGEERSSDSGNERNSDVTDEGSYQNEWPRVVVPEYYEQREFPSYVVIGTNTVVYVQMARVIWPARVIIEGYTYHATM